jgi:PPK2 family polyphosphate:nucleotide phosphotransferase
MAKIRMPRVREFVRPYRVDSGKGFRLTKWVPADTAGLGEEKKQAREILAAGVRMLADLQDRLYAQDRWSVLVILQAMDAAGKDSTIKHVMSGVNPQGCEVHSFRVPSAEELDHDFLWRTTKRLPERGRIGIFNRSYYEEVLAVRVHPEILAKQKLPRKLVTKKIWKERFRSIADFERHLARNGTVVLKFFLNVSLGEQKKRFLERLDLAEKNWKFSESDAKERGFWKDYMAAYEDAIRATARPWAPWYVVPADNKWFSRLVVAGAIIDAMERLDLRYPVVDDAKKNELKAARALLDSE